MPEPGSDLIDAESFGPASHIARGKPSHLELRCLVGAAFWGIPLPGFPLMAA